MVASYECCSLVLKASDGACFMFRMHAPLPYILGCYFNIAPSLYTGVAIAHKDIHIIGQKLYAKSKTKSSTYFKGLQFL